MLHLLMTVTMSKVESEKQESKSGNDTTIIGKGGLQVAE